MTTKLTDRKQVKVPSTIGASRKGQMATAWTKYRSKYGPHLTPKQAFVLRQRVRKAEGFLKEVLSQLNEETKRSVRLYLRDLKSV